MFNASEKEELKRIISKYVEEGRCTWPIHPDEVLREVKRCNQTEDSAEADQSRLMHFVEDQHSREL